VVSLGSVTASSSVTLAINSSSAGVALGSLTLSPGAVSLAINTDWPTTSMITIEAERVGGVKPSGTAHQVRPSGQLNGAGLAAATSYTHATRPSGSIAAASSPSTIQPKG